MKPRNDDGNKIDTDAQCPIFFTNNRIINLRIGSENDNAKFVFDFLK